MGLRKKGRKEKRKKAHVEVELPERMADESDARGVNFDEALEEALKKL